MLPRFIYRLLPYFYIGLGLCCIIIFESRLVFISSALLIAAGCLVLWMRHKNAVNPVEYVDDLETLNNDDTEIILDASTMPPGYDRRFDNERSFPLIDDKEGLIAFDRRTNESDKKD